MWLGHWLLLCSFLHLLFYWPPNLWNVRPLQSYSNNVRTYFLGRYKIKNWINRTTLYYVGDWWCVSIRLKCFGEWLFPLLAPSLTEGGNTLWWLSTKAIYHAMHMKAHWGILCEKLNIAECVWNTKKFIPECQNQISILISVIWFSISKILLVKSEIKFFRRTFHLSISFVNGYFCYQKYILCVCVSVK